MSIMSFSFSLHNIISLMLALFAARIFSLIPPTGNTLPRKVISPVMANLFFTLRWVNTETNEVSAETTEENAAAVETEIIQEVEISDEEATEEPATEGPNSEETSSEEVPEEATVEEPKAEETPAEMSNSEDTTAEDKDSEDTSAEEGETKK